MTAFSGELAATAAFKTLRGLFSGDDVPPGCTLGFPVAKVCDAKPSVHSAVVCVLESICFSELEPRSEKL